jgi:hypothetical protein
MGCEVRGVVRTPQLLALLLIVVATSLLPAAAQEQVSPQPLPPVASDDTWFGAAGANSAPQMALNAGVKWQRLIFPWNEIQPNSTRDFQSGYFTDAQIDAQLAMGLEVVGITLYTPTWAARDTRYGASSMPQNLDLPIDDPRNYWAAYVKRLVSHYRGRINTWIFYNEPDIYHEPAEYITFAGTPADYARVLKTGYLAAKSVNPDVKIVMAGMTFFWDHEERRPQYFQRVLDAIVADPNAARNNWYFDVADVHAYANPLNSFAIPSIFRGIMRSKGIDKPIWLDESNAVPKNDPIVGSGDGPFRASLDDQASYVIQSMALARAAGVQRYGIYKVGDDFPENDDEWFGLVRNDGTVRPAYVAYQVAVRYFQNTRRATYWWAGSQMPPTDQEIASLVASVSGHYQFIWPAPANAVTIERDTDRVTVVWNGTNQPAQIAIPAIAASAQLVDKYGRVTAIAPENGAYQLALEPSRNNSDPRDPSLYLVGGSPWILVENIVGP